MEVVPTMSLDGFVNDENLKIVKIYQYFLTTLKSQSVIYVDTTISYDSTIKVNITNTNAVANDLEMSLSELYLRYYTDVEVNVEVTENDESNSIGALIDIKIVKDDKSYTLSKSISIVNGKLHNLSNIIDYFKS